LKFKFVLTTRRDKGLMEDYFFDYLKVDFKNDVINNVSIETDNNKIVPDFLLIYETKYFVIEIDEPYALDSNSILIPIHYIGKDTIKSQLLLNNGISIFRFAEEQIVKHPEKCVKFIRDSLEVNKESFEFFIPCWDKEQSIQYINQKYRDSYLPIPLETTRFSKYFYSYRSFKILNCHERNLNGEVFKVLILSNDFYSQNEFKEVHKLKCFIEKESFEKALKAPINRKTLGKFENNLIVNIQDEIFSFLRLESICHIHGNEVNLWVKNQFKLICTEPDYKEFLDFKIAYKQEEEEIKRLLFKTD
jgi:hypothetical protein